MFEETTLLVQGDYRSTNLGDLIRRGEFVCVGANSVGPSYFQVQNLRGSRNKGRPRWITLNHSLGLVTLS